MDNEEECAIVWNFFTALLSLASGVPDASLFTSTSTLNPAFSSPAVFAVPSVQFEDVDGDGNGQVSTEEILRKINQMTNANIDKVALNALIHTVDTNGDGVLSIEEDTADVQFDVTKESDKYGDRYIIRMKGQADSYKEFRLGVIGGLSAFLLIPTAIVAKTYYDNKAEEEMAKELANKRKREEAEEIRAYKEAQKKKNDLKKEYRKNRKKILGKLRL